ncbi:hypothetical protein [Mycolicibacterium hodleri]|uniref:Uncharacterized protein n=1 Tax=Mycolicibacterium hodleri TaxID=49897 RepID=A0A502E1G2_9MYCO|nr:hypothetical protein [Mycolicibacterium hodleri]TPG31443.1 hypothetical protein EAH80_23390 [Mycolicibacterium hodleri]
MAAGVAFVIGVSSQRVDQIVDLGAGQYQVLRVVMGSDRENPALKFIVDKPQGSQDRGTASTMMSWRGGTEVNGWRRRSSIDTAQLLMVPSPPE